jgi:hypothetical protein
MFGVPCLFRDTRGLAGLWSAALGGGGLSLVDTAELVGHLSPIVAVENAPGAASVYETRLPAGSPSIVVGNERRGIRGDILRAADRCVQIPMPGRVNTLNVAAAAAVALYFLLGDERCSMRRPRRPDKDRPAVLLAGPGDHVEAGSALRSAAAFGWRSVGLDDSRHVWFGVPRAEYAEGRAAARSHRNSIRIVPMASNVPLGFARVVVAGTRIDGPPLGRVSLTGARTLIVLPDEESTDPAAWARLGPKVEFATIPLPEQAFPYRYRLVASIVLAEVARQIGLGRALPTVPRPRRFAYESALEVAGLAAADLVTPEELRAY